MVPTLAHLETDRRRHFLAGFDLFENTVVDPHNLFVTFLHTFEVKKVKKMCTAAAKVVIHFLKKAWITCQRGQLLSFRKWTKGVKDTVAPKVCSTRRQSTFLGAGGAQLLWGRSGTAPLSSSGGSCEAASAHSASSWRRQSSSRAARARNSTAATCTGQQHHNACVTFYVKMRGSSKVLCNENDPQILPNIFDKFWTISDTKSATLRPAQQGQKRRYEEFRQKCDKKSHKTHTLLHAT